MNRTCSKSRSLSAVCVLLALLSVSCAKHANLTLPQQAEYTLNQTVAVIASSNKAMASAVIAANQANALDNTVSNEILNYNLQVARTIEGIVPILRNGKTWPERSAAVLALLRQLKLPASISAFLASSHTDQAVIAVVQIIVTVHQLVSSLTGTVAGTMEVQR